jgi:hypothetical protein
MIETDLGIPRLQKSAKVVLGRVLINVQIAATRALRGPATSVVQKINARSRLTPITGGRTVVVGRYLPQATEEDHGAHSFKSTGWNCCAHLRSGGDPLCFNDPG